MPQCKTILQAGLPVGATMYADTKKHLQCISNLPDLEITPIPTHAATSLYNERLHEVVRQNAAFSETRGKYSKEERDMMKLLSQLPILCVHFILHKKIGEGTYSTVYLATYRNCKSKKQFAVKHLTDSFSLSRIQKELKFMQMIGGCDNVVSALNCFKSENKDCVVFVMPYLQHKRFSEYVLDMDSDELRLYMKNLFIALRRVHTFNVIHRDVKPGNFLYNREKKDFLLVDFGLAQDVKEVRKEKFSSPEGDGENAPINYSKRKRTSTDDGNPVTKVAVLSPLKSRENIMPDMPYQPEWRPVQMPSPITLHSGENRPPRAALERTPPRVALEPSPLKQRTSSSSGLNTSTRNQLLLHLETSLSAGSRSFNGARREPSLGTSLLKSQTECRLATTPKDKPSANEQTRAFTPLVASQVPAGSFVQVRNSQVVGAERAKCACAGTSVICTPCSTKRVVVAPRAGTPGFRPPEVLLKSHHQTTAVDMWAAGVVMLCVLSGCYPFFKSPNDLSALVEIINVFGSEAVEEIAHKLGKKVSTSVKRNPLDLKKLCRRLRSRRTNQWNPKQKLSKCETCRQSIRQNGCVCSTEPLSCKNTWSDGDIFPDSAYHLLSRLLDLNPATRITAKDALLHPFIAHL